MMERKLHTLSLPSVLPDSAGLISLKVGVGDQVQKGTVMATYGALGAESGGAEESSANLFKSNMVGKVCGVLRQEGDCLQPK
jgi:predicted deacylase